jgi:hypothetical protein
MWLVNITAPARKFCVFGGWKSVRLANGPKSIAAGSTHTVAPVRDRRFVFAWLLLSV